MKTILALAALLGAGVSPASAQTPPNMAATPADRSTGPTVPRPRSMELDMAMPPSASPGASATDRLAAGSLDSDPHNPGVAPNRSSRPGASPTR
jgi:hypothetical protein